MFGGRNSGSKGGQKWERLNKRVSVTLTKKFESILM